MGASAYVGYNTKAGWMAGVSYGFGPNIGYGGFSAFSNMTSIGISVSQKGGFSANYLGLQYSHGNFSFDPSIGVGYTYTWGNYGTQDVLEYEDDFDLNYENPIEYNRESAYHFMWENGLTDINEQWNNLYADGRLPSDNYSYNENGEVIKNGNKVLGLVKSYRKFLGKLNLDIYLYKAAFINPEKLYLVIGHELTHVALYRLGYFDSNRHEATTYKWNAEQAAAWGLHYTSNVYKGQMWSQGNNNPYPYTRPIRPNRPVKP